LGSKDIGIRKSEFVARTQFLCGNSWEFPVESSSEPIPENFLETNPKIFSRVPPKYLDIFSAYS